MFFGVLEGSDSELCPHNELAADRDAGFVAFADAG